MYLDQDVPSFMISGICQEDEPYYSIGALNAFLKEKNQAMAGVQQPIATGLQLFITPLALASFKLFGNNYWGLRIPVAIMGCGVLLLYFLFIKRKVNDPGSKLFLILLFAADFYFFLFSRFNNPQLQSIFIISIICYLYCVPPKSDKWKYLLIGFLAIFLITAVYLYNLFIVAAIGITAIVFAVKAKRFANVLWLFLGGIIAVLLVYLGLWYYNINIEKLFHTLFSIADSRGEVSVKVGMADLFVKSAFTLLQFTATNFIRFNLGYLVLMFLGIFLIIRDKSLFKNEYNLFFLLCFIMLLFQSVFVVSYPFKKHITFLPLLSFLIINQWENIVGFDYNLLQKRDKLFFIFMIALSMLFAAYNIKVNNSPEYWASFNYGYYENLGFIYILINIIAFILFTMSFFVVRSWTKYFKYALLVPGLMLILDYCFINRSYTMSTELKLMKQKYENKIFIEGFSHALQFYSGIIPTVSHYDRGVDYSEMEIDSLYKNSQPAYCAVKYFNNNTSLRDLNKGDTLKIHGRIFVVEDRIKMKYYNFGILKFLNN